jgi:hypothetical protein
VCVREGEAWRSEGQGREDKGSTGTFSAGEPPWMVTTDQRDSKRPEALCTKRGCCAGGSVPAAVCSSSHATPEATASVARLRSVASRDSAATRASASTVRAVSSIDGVSPGPPPAPALPPSWRSCRLP